MVVSILGEDTEFPGLQGKSRKLKIYIKGLGFGLESTMQGREVKEYSLSVEKGFQERAANHVQLLGL